MIPNDVIFKGKGKKEGGKKSSKIEMENDVLRTG